ncbi:MAG: lysylphosphatidylglycerol synthase transmembrane domain-containing protein [Anaerolineales bacterium]
MKKRLLLALVVTLVIGAVFFWLVDLEQVIALLQAAEWRLLAAAIGALIFSYVLMAVRWRYLLANRTGFFPSFHAINISNLVNSLTPIPEIAVRVLITGSGTDVSIPGATSGMLVERSLEQVMRVLAFILALLTGYVISFQTGSIIFNVGLVLGLLVLMFWLIRNAETFVGKIQILLRRFPKLNQQQVDNALEDLVTGLRTAGGPWQLTYTWLMSFAIWGAFFIFAYLVLLGLKIHLPVEQLAAIALLTLAVAPPSAPGTPGLYQATIVGALSLVAGFNPALMTAFAIMIHILQVIPLFFLGIWGALGMDISLRTVYRQQPITVETEKR